MASKRAASTDEGDEELCRASMIKALAGNKTLQQEVLQQQLVHRPKATAPSSAPPPPPRTPPEATSPVPQQAQVIPVTPPPSEPQLQRVFTIPPAVVNDYHRYPRAAMIQWRNEPSPGTHPVQRQYYQERATNFSPSRAHRQGFLRQSIPARPTHLMRGRPTLEEQERDLVTRQLLMQLSYEEKVKFKLSLMKEEACRKQQIEASEALLAMNRALLQQQLPPQLKQTVAQKYAVFRRHKKPVVAHHRLAEAKRAAFLSQPPPQQQQQPPNQDATSPDSARHETMAYVLALNSALLREHL